MIVSFGAGITTLTGPLIDGYVLRQTFVAEDSFISSVHVLLSTYKRRNSGSLIGEIVDSANKSLSTCIVVADKIEDNQYQEFNLPTPIITGRTYEFRIRTVHCRAGQAPTAHHSIATKQNNNLFVSGKLQRGRELVCRIEYGKPFAFVETPRSVSPDFISGFLRTEPFLSIVILNKDGYDLIVRCVDSILQGIDEPLEIIIGDTGTTDQRVLDYYDSLTGVTVVRNLDYNFSKLNNQLVVSHARGSHVLFLNNDVFLPKDAIPKMLDYARVFNVGAVGLRLLKPRGVIEHDGQILFNSERRISVPDHLNVNFDPSMKPSVDGITEGVTAACMLTPRRLFLDLGGFDEQYKDIYQDCDYCLKLTRAGFKCITVRTTSAIHVGSATRGVTIAEKTQYDREKYLSNWSSFSAPTPPRMSIVTCCNNPDTYMGMVNSLRMKTNEAELIPVMNRDNRFTVTESLNLARISASGEFIAYSHQDVLYPPGWIQDVLEAIRGIDTDKIGAIGFEGLADGGTPYSCKQLKPSHHVRVQTLDELSIILPANHPPFDEGFRFHYYGADICMQCIEQGRTNWIVGIKVKHLSGGAENILKDMDGFKREAEHFRAKWPDRDIWTTTTKFLNDGIYYMILSEILNEREE